MDIELDIGLDFDGVFVDCGRQKSAAAKTIYGIDIPPDKFKKEIVVGGGYLTAEQYSDLQRLVYNNRDIPMFSVSGAIHFIPRLTREGHTIRVITGRDGVGLEIARDWAVSKRMDLEFVGVGDETKVNAAKGCDVFVDDDLDNLRELVGVVPHRFLFSWGYNANEEAGDIAERVDSWEHLYNTIQMIKGVR